jgi:hypothetical protein
MRWAMKYGDFGVAAPQQTGSALEDRLLAALAGVSAYAMRRFSAAHGFHRRRSSSCGAKLLCLACFNANEVAFQVAYAINRRRLGRIGRERSAS